MKAPTRVPVCMRCGNRDIRPQTIGDGLWPGGGEGMRWTCDRCGYQGAPLLMAPDEATPPDGSVRWDDATPQEVALAPLPPPKPQPVFGALLLVVAGFFLIPGILPWFSQDFGPGSVAGTLAMSSISLLFVVFFGRVGWRQFHPAAP